MPRRGTDIGTTIASLLARLTPLGVAIVAMATGWMGCSDASQTVASDSGPPATVDEASAGATAVPPEDATSGGSTDDVASDASSTTSAEEAPTGATASPDEPSDAASSDEWPECGAQTHDSGGGGARFSASTWPWAEIQNEIVPIESGVCRVVSVMDDLAGMIVMSCTHEDGGSHELKFYVGIAARGLEYLLKEENITLRFQDANRVYAGTHNHIILRRQDGTLLLSTASFRCVNTHIGNPLRPIDTSDMAGSDFDTWHAPFGDFIVIDDLCPDTDDPRGMA
ncbi:MAG: hypothetical protein V3V08_21360, partial [Nannocystaceae bacterium]